MARCLSPCRTRVVLGCGVTLAVMVAATPTAGNAQSAQQRRPATTLEVVAGNVLIGGATAAIRALFADADPLRAFAIGAFGGAVHLAGKNLAVEPAPAHGILGLVVAGTGTSIVANAGRGVNPLRQVSIPFASLRLRLTPFDTRKISVSINAWESFVIARSASHRGARIDWSKSLTTGGVVFMAPRHLIRVDERIVGGVTIGPTLIVSGMAGDRDRVLRHEMVHVHQFWFLQDAIAGPLERFALDRLRFARRLPRWLELGLVSPMLVLMEDWVSDSDGFLPLSQAEAELLERR